MAPSRRSSSSPSRSRSSRPVPLLAIAGLKMRDILGYTTVTLIASGLVFATVLLVWSL